jgi:hypothetical protein
MAKFGGTVSEHIVDVFQFNNAGQMGTERADDVTPGGAREFGAFGQAQHSFVAALNAGDVAGVEPGTHYGQWLHDDWFI